jgi:lipopolysaccharide biosynthesis regulator YciM
MDLSLTLSLFGFPAVFFLGWLASRADLKQLRLEARETPKAYFNGLRFLLNEQQDQAIDAFIEAVQLDPDTTELHFALGNLFRRRGEYDRAVRVHEHLIGRADLSEADRNRAQFALATDFLRAGILDRAETVLQNLLTTSYRQQCQWALLSLYERTRDWYRASEIARQLHEAGETGCSARLAHFLCEQAAEVSRSNPLEAKSLLLQAQSTDTKADRPLVDLARLTVASEPELAFSLMLRLIDEQRPASALIATLFAQTAIQTGQATIALERLSRCYAQTQSLDILEGLVKLLSLAPELLGETHPQMGLYLQHVEATSSLLAAQRWLEIANLHGVSMAPAVSQAMVQATRPLQKYRCASCGFETQQHHWHCPGCQAWDSYSPRRIEEL